MGKLSVRLRILLFSTCFAFFFIQPVSANQVAEFKEFKFEYFLPIILAFAIALPVWKWFIPNQLSSLQVAFEIDDDLYEVHKITGILSDARTLLMLGTVGYATGLFIMGMTRLLILIAVLTFVTVVYFTSTLLFARFLSAVLFLI